MLSNLAARISAHPSCTSSSRHHWPCPHVHHTAPAHPPDEEAAHAAGDDDITSVAMPRLVCEAAIAGSRHSRSAPHEEPLRVLFRDELVDVANLARRQRERHATACQRRTRSEEPSTTTAHKFCRFCGRPHTAKDGGRAVSANASHLSASQHSSQLAFIAEKETAARPGTNDAHASASRWAEPERKQKTAATLDDVPECDGETSRAHEHNHGDPAPSAAFSAPTSTTSTSGRIIVKKRADSRAQQQPQPQQAAESAESVTAAPVDAKTPTTGTRSFKGAMYPAAHYQALWEKTQAARRRHATAPTASAQSRAKEGVGRATAKPAPEEPDVVITDKGLLVLPRHPLHLTVPGRLSPSNTQVRPRGTRSSLRVTVRWSARNESEGSDITRIWASQSRMYNRQTEAIEYTLSTTTADADASSAEGCPPTHQSHVAGSSCSSVSRQPSLLSVHGVACTCCAHCQHVVLNEESGVELWSSKVPALSLYSPYEETDDVVMHFVMDHHYRPTTAAPPAAMHHQLTSPTASTDGLATHFGQSFVFTPSSSPRRARDTFSQSHASKGYALQQQQQPHVQPPSLYAPVQPENKPTPASISTRGGGSGSGTTPALRDTGTTTATTTALGLSSSESGTPLNSELLLYSSQMTAAAATTSSTTPPLLPMHNGGVGGGHAFCLPHSAPSQQELFKAIVQRRKSSLRQDVFVIPSSTTTAAARQRGGTTAATTASSMQEAPWPLQNPPVFVGSASPDRHGGVGGATATQSAAAPFFFLAPTPSVSSDSRAFRQPSFCSSLGGGGRGGLANTTVATIGAMSTTPEASVNETVLAMSGTSFSGAMGGTYGGHMPPPRYGGYPPHVFTPEQGTLAALPPALATLPQTTQGHMAAAGGGGGAAAAVAGSSSLGVSNSIPTYPWSAVQPHATDKSLSDSMAWVGASPVWSQASQVAGAGVDEVRGGAGDGNSDSSANGPLGARGYGPRPSTATLAQRESLMTTPGPPMPPYAEEEDEDTAGNGAANSRQSSTFWDHAVTPLLRPLDALNTHNVPSLFATNGSREASLSAGMHHLTFPPPPGVATPIGSCTPFLVSSPYVGPVLPTAMMPSPYGTPVMAGGWSHSPPPSPAGTRPRAASRSLESGAAAPCAVVMEGTEVPARAHAAVPSTTTTGAAPAGRPFCRYEVSGHALSSHVHGRVHCPGLQDRLNANTRLEEQRRQHRDAHCYSLHNRGLGARPASSASAASAATPLSAPSWSAPLTVASKVGVASGERARAEEAEPVRPWCPFDDSYHKDEAMLEQLSLTTTSSCAFGAGLEGLCWSKWVPEDVVASYDAQFNELDDDDDDDEQEEGAVVIARDAGKAEAANDDTSKLFSDGVESAGRGTEGRLTGTSTEGSCDRLRHHSRSTSGVTVTCSVRFCTCTHPLSPMAGSPCGVYSLTSGDEPPTTSPAKHSQSMVSHETPSVEVWPGPTPSELAAGAVSAPRNWSESDDENTQRPRVPTMATSSKNASSSGGGGFRLFRSLRKNKKSEVGGTGATRDTASEHGDGDGSTHGSATRSGGRVHLSPGGQAVPAGSTGATTSTTVGFLPFTNWLFAHMEERRARKEEKHARKQRAKELVRVEMWRREKAEQQKKERKQEQQKAEEDTKTDVQLDLPRKSNKGSAAGSTSAPLRAPPRDYRLGDAATVSPCSPKDMLSESPHSDAAGERVRRARESVARGDVHKVSRRTAAIDVRDTASTGSGAAEATFAHSFPGVLLESTNTAATQRVRRALMVNATMETFSDPEAGTEKEENGRADDDTVAVVDMPLPTSVGSPKGTATLSVPVCARCHRPVRPATQRSNDTAARTPLSTTRATALMSEVCEEGRRPEDYIKGKAGGLFVKCRCMCLAPQRTGKFNIHAQPRLTEALLARHKALYAADKAIVSVKFEAERVNAAGLRKLVKDSKAVMSAEAAAVAAMWLHDAKKGVPAADVQRWREHDTAAPQATKTKHRNHTAIEDGAASKNAAASSTSSSSSSSAGSHSSSTSTISPVPAAAVSKVVSKKGGVGAVPKAKGSNTSVVVEAASPHGNGVSASTAAAHTLRVREASERQAVAAANTTLNRKRAAIESWLRHIE